MNHKNQPALYIDLTPFDPYLFFNQQDWRIVGQDTRTASCSRVNLCDIRLETALRESESWTTGEDNLHRFKNTADIVLLGAETFFALWSNQYLIPKSWKAKALRINFDGTILESPRGLRCVICLEREYRDSPWAWSCNTLRLTSRNQGDVTATISCT